jgi:Domain of unknown function (DUF1707)
MADRWAAALRFRALRLGEVPVMAGPGDEIAAGAGGPGHLRASHADREQVVSTLQAAFAQGRLTKGEFDLRVGQALASRTYADLAALTADIPAGLTTAKPPTPARAQDGQPVLRPGPVITAATVLYAGVWIYAMFFPKGGDGPSKLPIIFDGGLIYLIILAICVGQMVALRRAQRSGGQSPQRPAAGGGGPASGRLPSADPDRQLPSADPGHQHTAEAGRRRLPLLRGGVRRPGQSYST